MNKLRRGRGSPVVKKGNPSYAAVSLSDIRIPLLWRPKDHMEVSQGSVYLSSEYLTLKTQGSYGGME